MKDACVHRAPVAIPDNTAGHKAMTSSASSGPKPPSLLEAAIQAAVAAPMTIYVLIIWSCPAAQLSFSGTFVTTALSTIQSATFWRCER